MGQAGEGGIGRQGKGSGQATFGLPLHGLSPMRHRLCPDRRNGGID